MTAQNSREKVLGYDIGEISARGAVSVDLTIVNPNVPTQALIDAQYQDSLVMDKRPGMYLKYMPYQTHEVTGKILTGGSYLFNTLDDAEEYTRWIAEDYKTGDPETTFLERPLFEATSHIIWKVIGAHNSAPLEEHAVGRHQRWKCVGGDEIEKHLHNVYPAVRSAAESQGAVAVWLLYNQEEETVGLQLAFKKASDGTDEASMKQAGKEVSEKPSLESVIFDGQQGRCIFDRSSPFLTLWLPQSRASRGASRTTPWYPALPAISNEQP